MAKYHRQSQKLSESWGRKPITRAIQRVAVSRRHSWKPVLKVLGKRSQKYFWFSLKTMKQSLAIAQLWCIKNEVALLLCCADESSH